MTVHRLRMARKRIDGKTLSLGEEHVASRTSSSLLPVADDNAETSGQSRKVGSTNSNKSHRATDRQLDRES